MLSELGIPTHLIAEGIRRSLNGGEEVGFLVLCPGDELERASPGGRVLERFRKRDLRARELAIDEKDLRTVEWIALA